MKVYKNPFVSRDSYFVKTGVQPTEKAEASASKGYIVEYVNDKWNVRKGAYYDKSLKGEMPVVAENRISIKKVVENAILNAVLEAVGADCGTDRSDKE